MLFAWAAYAFAGAGLIRRLPLMRTALVLITGVYLLRGLVLIPALYAASSGGGSVLGRSASFMIWSSLIVLGYAAAYAVGTWRAWPRLGPG